MPLSGIDCKCAMMAVHEKGYHRVNVRAVQGDSAGLGVSNSPVLRVSKFIAEVSRMKFTCKMPTQVRAMFEALAPYMSFPLRMVFGNLWCMAPLLIKLIPKISPQAAATSAAPRRNRMIRVCFIIVRFMVYSLLSCGTSMPEGHSRSNSATPSLPLPVQSRITLPSPSSNFQ